MTAKRHLGIAAWALLALAIGGCALPVQVAETRAGPNLTARKAKAAALTRNGDLAAALVEWRVLEALAAGNAEVVRERRKLEAQIARRSAAEFESGRKASARGNLKQARRRFLAALKIDPNHGAAIEELRKIEVVRVRQRRPKFVDYKAARAAAAAKPAETPQPRAAKQDAGSNPQPDATAVRRASDLKEAAALARQGAHGRAIALLETHLKRYPEDREARARLSSSHAAIGMAHFKAGKLEEAVPHLEASVTLGGGDPRAARMLAKAKGRLAQEAYENGIRVFRQDVAQAIAYWEESLAYDPAHTKAKFHLEKAYRIQATLESIKP